MSNRKYYTEKEVGELIRRAAEIQAKAPESNYVPGVTSAELEALAKEVGISSEALLAAIHEQEQSAAGSPKESTFERIVPVEIPTDHFDILTENIQLSSSVSSDGKHVAPAISQWGRSITGKAKSTWDSPQFKVTSRGGRTKIETSADVQTAWGLPFLFALLLIPAAGIGKAFGAWAGLALGALTVAMAVWAGFALAKESKRSARALADKLEKSALDYAAEQKLNQDNLDQDNLAKNVTSVSAPIAPNEETELNQLN